MMDVYTAIENRKTIRDFEDRLNEKEAEHRRGFYV